MLPIIIIAVVGLVGFYIFSNMTTGTVQGLTGNGPRPGNSSVPQGNWGIPPRPMNYMPSPPAYGGGPQLPPRPNMNY